MPAKNRAIIRYRGRAALPAPRKRLESGSASAPAPLKFPYDLPTLPHAAVIGSLARRINLFPQPRSDVLLRTSVNPFSRTGRPRFLVKTALDGLRLWACVSCKFLVLQPSSIRKNTRLRFEPHTRDRHADPNRNLAVQNRP